MPKSRIIITLGALIALLPLLGFPHSWESFFQIISGLAIILLSVWHTVDKRMKLQAKAQARQVNRVTDFYPKTAPAGRRATDIRPPEHQQPTL